MIIAIDGPSGAGKSTVAKEVARSLGFACLDTGAMYRAVACFALRNGVPLDDDERLGDIARRRPIRFEHTPGDPAPRRVFIDDIDVTQDIRSAEVDRAVSPVSASRPVREALVDQQRVIGASGDYVVEGRDIGTTVFPDAELKVFLVADPAERAHRRVRQNIDRGFGETDFDIVHADILRRDEIDSGRDASPLRAADDAVTVDSTSMHIEDVIGFIRDLARERG